MIHNNAYYLNKLFLVSNISLKKNYKRNLKYLFLLRFLYSKREVIVKLLRYIINKNPTIYI